MPQRMNFVASIVVAGNTTLYIGWYGGKDLEDLKISLGGAYPRPASQRLI